MAKKQNYYVVWEGYSPGIYMSWEECQKQINGYPTAKFKAFGKREEAEYAQKRNYYEFVKPRTKTITTEKASHHSEIIEDSICVDAACSGNPGMMEYRGVDTKTRKQLFHQGPFLNGTNNIGEFLGIVHGLAMLKKNKKDNTTIYSDSKIAIGWIKAKKAKTKLVESDDNKILFALLERAENWLEQNTYSNPIIKWDTASWGEIPADFGRK